MFGFFPGQVGSCCGSGCSYGCGMCVSVLGMRGYVLLAWEAYDLAEERKRGEREGGNRESGGVERVGEWREREERSYSGFPLFLSLSLCFLLFLLSLSFHSFNR